VLNASTQCDLPTSQPLKKHPKSPNQGIPRGRVCRGDGFGGVR
jgi:hypothetical protein